MTQAVVGVFHTPAEAERAVADMIGVGFRRERISLIGPGSPQAAHVEVEGSKAEHAEDMVIGAVCGGLLGGILGTIVGMLVMVLPGLSAALTMGPVGGAVGGVGMTMALGALAGGAIGGVLGALTWARVTTDEAHVYEACIRRGGALVVVQAERAECARAADILHHDGAISASDLEAEWRREGLD